jgi:hypothetical protein
MMGDGKPMVLSNSSSHPVTWFTVLYLYYCTSQPDKHNVKNSCTDKANTPYERKVIPHSSSGKQKGKVLPGFEPGLPEHCSSKSGVITATLQNRRLPYLPISPLFSGFIQHGRYFTAFDYVMTSASLSLGPTSHNLIYTTLMS